MNKIITKKNIILTSVFALIMLISFFLIARVVSSPSFFQSTMKSIDDKRSTVLALTATSAASSTAITLIPGNVGMPIANQLAELSKYLLIVLSALTFEKILLSAIGYISFKVIIPISCIFAIAAIYFKNKNFVKVALKTFILGIVTFIAVPLGIKTSDVIYDTYYSTYVHEASETVASNNEYIQSESENSQNDDFFSNIKEKVTETISAGIKKGEESLSKLVDSIAILIVTACLIPITIILLILLVIKYLFKLNLPSIPTKKKPAETK